MKRGFTLVELLVVITIILVVSLVALPVIIPALSHRQVSEGARTLQGVLAGARDQALHDNSPSGIRLLPDPTFPLQYLPNGQIDPSQPLVASRIIPIGPAPSYSEGLISRIDTVTLPNGFMAVPALMVCEQVATAIGPNNPTSWFWNIRIGDKIQFNKSNTWYTVVGPMVQGPAQGNAELFVNVGPAGTASPYTTTQAGLTVFPEFLWLVDGRDDNANGWIDEGFDGVDNNADGTIDELAEWEIEAWQGPVLADGSSYEVQRRPVPLSNSREISLPTNVVIDLTTWNGTQERSRLPVNVYSGYVDVMVRPNGTTTYNLPYSTPAAASSIGPFFHFWLAERSDVISPVAGNQAPLLPIGNTIRSGDAQPSAYAGTRLQGEFAIVSLSGQSGRITSSSNTLFDDPLLPYAQQPPYGATNPPIGYLAVLPFMPNMGGQVNQ